jgi:hypothetical protein
MCAIVLEDSHKLNILNFWSERNMSFMVWAADQLARGNIN